MTTEFHEISKQDRERTKKLSFMSLGTFATSILAVVAVLGLFLTLAGYGVALSVEAKFGIPHASIFKSSSDLFSLSVWFITWGLGNLLETLKAIFFMPLYWKAIGLSALFGMACSLIALLVVLIQRRGIKNRMVSKFPSLKTASETKLAALLTLIFGGIGGSITLIGAPVLLYLGLFFCFVVGVIPAISLEAGESHIRKYVIEPAGCMKTATREQRIELYAHPTPKDTPRKYAATCVKIIEGERTIAFGRVVFSTTELIVLYNPTTGSVTRESTSGRSIQVISEL